MIEVTDEMKDAFRAAQEKRAAELVAEGAPLGAHDILDRGLAAVLAIVERDRKAAVAKAAAEKRPTREMLDAYVDVAPSGMVSVWGVMAVLAVAEMERQ